MNRQTARRGVRLATPVLRRALRRTLVGRRVDPDDPARGRLSRRRVDRILTAAIVETERLLPVARLERLPTSGNQLNVVLAVVTVALYRAVVDAGVPPGQAKQLVADAGWRLYELGARPIMLAARLRHRGRYARLASALRLLLRFPFSAPGRPGYEVETFETADGFATTWTFCPPLAFVRTLVGEQGDHGELEVFQASWCTYDWAFNDLLAGGRGNYRRPHSLSAGDDRCDMTWSVST